MVRSLALAFLLMLGGLGPATAQEWAKRMFQTTTHDFGSVARYGKAEYRFVLSNIYLEDVHVASARPSCGCISTKVEKPLLKTYEKGAIVATLNTKSFLGRRYVTITVTLDKPFYARVYLQVRGYIRSDVVLQPGAVDLGTVDCGTPVEQTVSVSRRGRSDWRILEVKSANPHLTGEVADVTRQRDWVCCRLRVRLDAQAPVGVIQDHLLLVTNDESSQTIPVLVEGQVVSSVEVTPGSLFLGVLKPGQQVTKQLVVRAKEPFRITSITTQGDGLQVQSPTSDVAKPLHLIPITFTVGDRPGKATQTIRIETDLNAAAEMSAFAVIEPE
jgi:hypothetical protein